MYPFQASQSNEHMPQTPQMSEERIRAKRFQDAQLYRKQQAQKVGNADDKMRCARCGI